MDNSLLLLVITISVINQVFLIIALYMISRQNSAKNQKETITNPKETTENDENNSVNLSLFIENSNKLVELINIHVMEEVSSTLWKLQSLNKPYEAINMDTDISRVSEKVFKMIRNDIIGSNQTIYTEDALMTMIVNKTMNAFIRLTSS